MAVGNYVAVGLVARLRSRVTHIGRDMLLGSPEDLHSSYLYMSHQQHIHMRDGHRVPYRDDVMPLRIIRIRLTALLAIWVTCMGPVREHSSRTYH